MRTARFWWISLGYFCGLYVWYAVQVHQTKFLLDIGFSPNVAVWALGVVSLLGIPGQIWLGHLSDRIGREWIWAISCAGFAICFAALIALNSTPVLPLVYLMNPAHHQRRRFQYDGGGERQFLSMPWPSSDAAGRPTQYFIWGATAAMLRNLYRFLQA